MPAGLGMCPQEPGQKPARAQGARCGLAGSCFFAQLPFLGDVLGWVSLKTRRNTRGDVKQAFDVTQEEGNGAVGLYPLDGEVHLPQVWES